MAAARVLIDSGRDSQQERVFDAFFDQDESPSLMEALLGVVRPALLDETGALAEDHAKRLRKMVASSRPEWRLHGLRITAALGVADNDDKAMELLKEASKAIARNLQRDPGDRERMTQEVTELRVSCAVLAGAVPPSPDFLWSLQSLAKSSERDLRQIAVETYIRLGVDIYAEVLAAAVSDESSNVSRAAQDALIDARRPEVVPALIAQLDEQATSADTQVLQSLFRATGQRYLTRKQWDKWLERTQPVIVLSDEEYELAKQTLVDAIANSRYGPQGSFFARPVSERGVVFLLDVSSSMTAAVGNRTQPAKGIDIFIPNELPTRNRLDLVKSQVLNTLAGLQDQHFNIITFGTDVEVWSKGGSSAFDDRQAALDSATAFVKALRPHGSTAMHAGLEAAFKQDDIGEIFLLSDGDPSTGITDPKRICRDVKRWGQKAKDVALHCISMGTSNDLLEELGPQTPGGSYAEVEVSAGR